MRRTCRAVVEVLKVSSKSNPNSVAGALNQAIKAVAIARGFVAPSNIDLVCIPTFADIEIDGQSRTAIRLAVEDRSHRHPADGAPAATAVAGGVAVPVPASSGPLTAPILS